MQMLHSMYYFNPRSREGSDIIPMQARIAYLEFQSTLPRGERQDRTDTNNYNSTISIHAPPRGATTNVTFKSAGICISIHAPARGATKSGSPIVPVCDISIHAPARGATARADHLSFLYGIFQSTLPRGERQKIAINSVTGLYDFNPRSREGSD